MIISDKQQEYLYNATRRWNAKTGAVRAGKSFVDTLAVIPKRIKSRAGKAGLNVILGVTEKTIIRNVIEPMQELYGTRLVGNISQNACNMFGEKVWCLGAEKINQTSKIQGASIKYLYCDEVAKFNEEVFAMVKSRLDKEYSCADMTCNPEYPKHWFKQFLDDESIDIYHQHYTIDDNPYLPKVFIEQLKNEYRGTVFYKRYIQGLWSLAEGLIYNLIADNPQEFIIKKDELPHNMEVYFGGDFGKNKSDTSFVATGFHNGKVYALLSKSYEMGGKTYDQLEDDFRDFVETYNNLYTIKPSQVWLDSAEPTYINSFRKAFPQYNIRGSIKREILERIRATNILLATGKMFFVDKYTEPLIEALCEAVWDETKAEDVRLDDGTSDIDTLDAFEYSFEYKINQLVRL